ncbi:Hemolysin family protein [Candidatus Bealeia paramacronuclearis]|uniref:Hemolysin family protein n=1 Tax=Candidatus Bealeia paramacronuclearis TaxID=1921001 RepID=A0ABZ2C2J8_9PROT|nr:Hemolysin family protein [Candidatus Bealeia paramacronuclearis]
MSFVDRLKKIIRRQKDSDSTLRDTIEGLIEEDKTFNPSLAPDERAMLANILKLRDLTAEDVMIPRADIVAISQSSTREEILSTFRSADVMRLPIFHTNLDDIYGYIHIRDLIDTTPENFNLAKITRKIEVIAPAMGVLDLLLKMRLSGERLAMVVDEYGGIDGLVTMGDLVEEIVGDIQNVADSSLPDQIYFRPDGVVIVDARIEIEDLEEKLGPILATEDRDEDIETLGGLVFALAERIPQRGELITYEGHNLEFEIIEADPRRIKRIGIHGIAPQNSGA